MSDPIDLAALPPLLRVPEAAQVCRVGRRQMYRLVADDVVPSVKLGNSVRIPTAALLQLLGLGDKRTYDRDARYRDLDAAASLKAVT